MKNMIFFTKPTIPRPSFCSKQSSGRIDIYILLLIYQYVYMFNSYIRSFLRLSHRTYKALLSFG